MELLLCTGNPGKLAELRALLPPRFTAIALKEAGLPEDLPESGDTLEANALEKARFAAALSGLTTIADDTGLEVQALGGAPGVKSARYAGDEKDPQANMKKLLAEMSGITDRRAQFRTVIALIEEEGEQLFEGVVAGTIIDAPRGSGGFGYDPLFLPEMSDLTFAELDATAKNAISHRAQAMWKLALYLDERYP